MIQPGEPELFESARLFASDADNTQMLSFEKSPQGIGVEEAYRYGIAAIYGPSGVNQYIASGGHQNRTPAEIVISLVPFVKNPEVFQHVALMTELDYPTQDIVAHIQTITPSEKNITVSDLEIEELKATTRLLVDLKLQRLLSQVGLALPSGEYWPRPVPGFMDFMKLLRGSSEPIDSAIISAGHTQFIDSVYDLWGIERPDIYVTTETLSKLNLDEYFTPSELAKPSSLLMTVTEQLWVQKYGLPDTTAIDKEQIVYVGDDIRKDGGLARNSGVEFIHIDPCAPEESWRRVGKHLLLDTAITNRVVAHD
jgi:hypothetical protein